MATNNFLHQNLSKSAAFQIFLKPKWFLFSICLQTWNNSHIALVGKAMSSNESAAYEIMKALDVDYILVSSKNFKKLAD